MKLPEAFIQQMEELLGAEAPAFFSALETTPTTSIRLHPVKGEELFGEERSLPWSVQGRKLAKRPSFTFDPMFHAGAYYVQDGSSQFLEHALRQSVALQDPLVILDACAAPGGKTTHLQSLVAPGSVVIANEVISSRARILLENTWKWGMPDLIVTSADPKVLGASGLQVDVLVVDAPCSGEGLFRKDPDAMQEWSPEHVAHCAARQKRIVADLWPTLKPGGILLYSTCTWNLQENEEILAWAATELGADKVLLEVPTDWPVHQREGICRFLPQDDAGEGFCCGVLKKHHAAAVRSNKPFLPKEIQEGRALMKAMLSSPNMTPVAVGKTIFAVPQQMLPYVGTLQRGKVAVLSAGVPLGEQHGVKDMKPHPMVTHSTAFREDAFPQVQVDHDQALAYLRRQDVAVDGPAEKRVVVMHKGRRLGFAKLQNGRLSSQFPMDYRIRR